MSSGPSFLRFTFQEVKGLPDYGDYLIAMNAYDFKEKLFVQSKGTKYAAWERQKHVDTRFEQERKKVEFVAIRKSSFSKLDKTGKEYLKKLDCDFTIEIPLIKLVEVILYNENNVSYRPNPGSKKTKFQLPVTEWTYYTQMNSTKGERPIRLQLGLQLVNLSSETYYKWFAWLNDYSGQLEKSIAEQKKKMIADGKKLPTHENNGHFFELEKLTKHSMCAISQKPIKTMCYRCKKCKMTVRAEFVSNQKMPICKMSEGIFNRAAVTGVDHLKESLLISQLSTSKLTPLFRLSITYRLQSKEESGLHVQWRQNQKRRKILALYWMQSTLCTSTQGKFNSQLRRLKHGLFRSQRFRKLNIRCSIR